MSNYFLIRQLDFRLITSFTEFHRRIEENYGNIPSYDGDMEVEISRSLVYCSNMVRGVKSYILIPDMPLEKFMRDVAPLMLEEDMWRTNEIVGAKWQGNIDGVRLDFKSATKAKRVSQLETVFRLAKIL